jgi:hypothetical protein
MNHTPTEKARDVRPNVSVSGLIHEVDSAEGGGAATVALGTGASHSSAATSPVSKRSGPRNHSLSLSFTPRYRQGPGSNIGRTQTILFCDFSWFSFYCPGDQNSHDY